MRSCAIPHRMILNFIAESMVSSSPACAPLSCDRAIFSAVWSARATSKTWPPGPGLKHGPPFVAQMRASNRVYPPYFGGHSRDLRSVERFISIWLASKVICRCRMAAWTGTFPLTPLPLIKVVHDERRDCDRRAGQLHRRGDDSGKRGYGEGGDRYDVHEQHAVHGRDDLVAHIPAQHGDGAGDERHVEELRHDRPSLTAGRNRNVPQLDQHDVDRVHADESEKSRHRRVAVRRPCRKKARARCVDDPAKSADEERD